jgi:hypothetical protein
MASHQLLFFERALSLVCRLFSSSIKTAQPFHSLQFFALQFKYEDVGTESI